MTFEAGQDVIYDGRKTHIEMIYEDGSILIANPYWDWDSEGECVKSDLDYDVPYWITVKKSELKKA